MIKIYEMNDDDINEFITQHLPVKTFEKNKYGEVFTNPVLINKMLDLFPSSIWSNHKLKWIDPSVGAGFFMIYVYLRLMNGLKDWQTNKLKRSNWIITHMLYMVELNKNNCKICKSIFGSKLNILCSDFLSNHKYSNIKFDCIIGNPPFQDDYSTKNKTRKRINGGKSKLYERIFLKAYDMLKDDGWLSMVVPDNIFSGNGVKSYEKIINNSVPFVSFNPNNQSYFDKIQQPVCYFIMHKTGKPIETIIEINDDKQFKTILKNRPTNPIRNWTPQIEKLISKYVGNERNDVKYNRGKPINSYKGNKYQVIFTPSKNLQTNNEADAPGRQIKKAVLFAISPQLEFKMDYSGKFGAGPNTFWIPFDNNIEGKRLEKFLNSDEYKQMALATKTSRQFLKIPFIEHIKLTNIIKNNIKYTKKIQKYKHNKTRKNK